MKLELKIDEEQLRTIVIEAVKEAVIQMNIGEKVNGRPQLLTKKEVVQILKVCENSVEKLSKENELKKIRIGRSTRYNLVDVENYINKRIRISELIAT